MNEHSNENKMPREQKFENHVLKETIEIEKEVFEESLEKKPIKNILVIDDEEMIRDLFKEGLERFGYEVTVASNGNEGVKFFRENPADLIITDIFMQEKDGHTLIDEIMREFPEANIFAITRELNIAEALGAKRVFAKPVKLSELLDAIKELSPEIKTVSV